MVYFELKNLGFDCGQARASCPEHPKRCNQCVQEQLRKMGFKFESNIKIMEMDSDEKRLEMFQEQIWQKFLNVLNIKHVVIMDQNSGLPIINYPISESGIQAELLSGFIQANVNFSETSGSTDKDSVFGYQFYEFQYKDFTILLKNGRYSRVCLILDHSPSKALESIVREFLLDFERLYRWALQKLQESGAINFENLQEFIIDAFNVQLVFPMILSHTIPPDIIESIETNKIQNSVLKFAEDILRTKHFFFIHSLLNEIKSIVDVDPKIILYEIYQLLIKNVLIPTTIEKVDSEVKNFQEQRAMKMANSQVISHIITSEDSNSILDELKEKAKHMNPDMAKKCMDQYVKKGKTAEKAKIYKEAQKEYEKALYLATGFNFNVDIGKISFMVLELDKKIGELEFEFAVSAGENAEKKKNYIDSIKHYKKAIFILEKDINASGVDAKIKKLEKKISKLQILL